MEPQNSLAARLDRWWRDRTHLADTVLAAVMWVLFGLTSALVSGVPGLIVATATIVPLAVRRRYPVGVLLWEITIFAIQLAVIPLPLPANIAQAFVLYTVAAHVASLPMRLLALGSALAGVLLAGFRWSTPPAYRANSLATAGFLAAFTVLIWIIGNLVRGREVNRQLLREAAAQQEKVTAAREIHDIVAHSLTVVIVQADAASYAAEHAQPWDRVQASKALSTIGGTARQALSEVRNVIDVLREADGPGDAQASLAVLRQLLASVRAAGLTVELDSEPAEFDQLPPAVRFALLRVTREALTNVLKHAGNAYARVSFEQTPSLVRLSIVDNGTGMTSAEDQLPGHGIDGMRERLRALGGVLSAGPPADGGFAVVATIPLSARKVSR